MAYAPSEDSDQPRSLATHWVHSHFVGFVMRRLVSLIWMQLQPKHDKTYKITSSLCIFCSLIRVLAWPSVNSQECKQTLVRLCGCAGWSGSLLGACDFYAPPPESGGVLCYTLRNFECPSVRPSVCPSVRPSVSAHHHSCIGNSSYSFRPILLKLYRYFKNGLKICILFFSESWNYFLSLFSHF